jgi:hypothetical protein
VEVANCIDYIIICLACFFCPSFKCNETLFLHNFSMLLSPYFQEFVANEGGGELPLEGTIPDMTSLTESVSCWCHSFSFTRFKFLCH